MKKILLVIQGETYRDGYQGTRTRCTQRSIPLQEAATASHVQFIRALQQNFGYECDVVLNLYSANEELDNKIINLYSQYKIFSNFNKILLGESNLLNQSLQLINNNIINIYDSILFIRPDLYLKRYFSEIFNPQENKILFAHVNEICYNWHLVSDKTRPAVNHQITYIPKRFFQHLFFNKILFLHDSYLMSLNNGIKEEDIWFFIDTYHSSSTDITWNPIFHQVGREENKVWLDKGYRVDKTTRKPIFIDNDNIYENLINNDFNNNIKFHNNKISFNKLLNAWE